MIRDLLIVAAGGIIGSCSRYIVSTSASIFCQRAFPLGTLLVNSLGALLAGFLFGIIGSCESFKSCRLFCMVGFLGAFTTFSTYSVETMNMFFDGKIKLGFLNILLNNVVSFTLVFLGFWLAKILILKVD